MPSTGYLSVKNFARFQHYRDRTPPWIKLYNDVLDDYAFAQLPDASKAHLVLLWLLASRYNNRIPNDPEWIARRIGAFAPVDVGVLVSAGFVTLDGDASEPLTSCQQSADLEIERETEERAVVINLGARAREGREREVDEIIRAANVALGGNPLHEPIPAGHASRQDVWDWLDAGISTDAILAGVQQAAKAFRPDGRNKRIASMRYFTGPVQKAWDKLQSERTDERAATGTDGHPGRGGVRGAAASAPQRNIRQPTPQYD